MIFNILSVFKEMLKPSLKYGIISKAIKNKKIKVNLYSYNDFLIKGEMFGNQIENGKMMFVFQAQLAFNIWHNVLPTVDKETVNFITK